MTKHKEALEALDYVQHDWQQKDGQEVFQEQCEIVRKALQAASWQPISTVPYDQTVLIANEASCRLYRCHSEGHKYHVPHFAEKDGYTHWRSYTPPAAPVDGGR